MVCLAASLTSTALRASTSFSLHHAAFHLQHLSWTLDTISVLFFTAASFVQHITICLSCLFPSMLLSLYETGIS